MQGNTQNNGNAIFSFKCLNGKYYIGDQIGSGTYGKVFYSENMNGQPKVIKVVNLNQQSEKIKKCLDRQGKIMKELHSDYIIQLLQTMHDRKRKFKFIVMELCNYFNLFEIIFFKGHLKQIEAKIYLKNIFAGLISMHTFYYLHRDLKSTNICLRNGNCVIIDLGCSRSINRQNRSSLNIQDPMTATNVGTIINKSPEILRGQTKYTYKTDFWGIGVLYYEMLTGVAPFQINQAHDDKTALKIIKQNIQKIYNSQYIQERIKKHSLLAKSQKFKYRANKILSKEAIQFLSKLITLECEDRFNMDQIQKNSYLSQQLKIENIWEASECVLPLQNIKWLQFIQKLRQAKIQYNKTKKNKSESLIENNETYDDTECIEQISEEKRQKLKNNYKKVIQNDKINFNKARKCHFEIKRIKLLMNLRQEIEKIKKQNNNFQCEFVLLTLSEYCFNKISQIMFSASKDRYGIFSKIISTNFNNYFLSQHILKIYSQDRKNIDQLQKRGIKPPSWDQLLKNVIEPNGNLKKDKKLFFQNQNYKKIFKVEYEPSQTKYQWETWQSFKLIIGYINYMEDKKIQNNQLKYEEGKL